jgi:hypothetical protein
MIGKAEPTRDTLKLTHFYVQYSLKLSVVGVRLLFSSPVWNTSRSIHEDIVMLLLLLLRNLLQAITFAIGHQLQWKSMLPSKVLFLLHLPPAVVALYA